MGRGPGTPTEFGRVLTVGGRTFGPGPTTLGREPGTPDTTTMGGRCSAKAKLTTNNKIRVFIFSFQKSSFVVSAKLLHDFHIFPETE